MTDLLRPAQRALGHALRSRVAGPEAEQKNAVIWGTPGPRWFTAADPVWQVHGDASMFAGGVFHDAFQQQSHAPWQRA